MFRQCSSCSDTWDAFQVAEASFRLYCTSNSDVLSSDSNRKINYEMGPCPCLLGDPPKIDVVSPGADELEEESSQESLPSINIYDEDVTVRFLLCGPPCTVVGVVDLLAYFMILVYLSKSKYLFMISSVPKLFAISGYILIGIFGGWTQCSLENRSECRLFCL